MKQPYPIHLIKLLHPNATSNIVDYPDSYEINAIYTDSVTKTSFNEDGDGVVIKPPYSPFNVDTIDYGVT